MSETPPNAARTQDHERPLSPHLSIYKLPLTAAIMSITHRITGIAATAGLVFFVAWLWIAAYCTDSYAPLVENAATWWGQLLLAAWSLAYIYHFLNGIRHMFWDMGEGLELPAATRSGYIVLVGSFVATAGLWVALIA